MSSHFLKSPHLLLAFLTHGLLLIGRHFVIDNRGIPRIRKFGVEPLLPLLLGTIRIRRGKDEPHAGAEHDEHKCEHQIFLYSLAAFQFFSVVTHLLPN